MLITNRFDAINIPAARRHEFNHALDTMFTTDNATVLRTFSHRRLRQITRPTIEGHHMTRHNLKDWHEPSRNPRAPTRADRRVDPYWANLWDEGTQAAWMSRQLRERRAQHGLANTRLDGDHDWTDQHTRSTLVTGEQRLRRLSALAAVGMWRTLTEQQLGAFTGHPNPKHGGRYRRDDLRVLWNADLIERGTLVRDMPYDPWPPRLYRPAAGNAADRLYRQLPYPEWVAVTAGRPWGPGPQHDRHNLLAAELSLRASEWTGDIRTVAGETLARRDQLDPTVEVGATATLGGPTTAAGDAVWLRDDGLKIVIELQNHAAGKFPEKVGRWVEWMAEQPLESQGVVVLFVEAAKPELSKLRVFNQIQQTVVDVLESDPAALRAQVGRRLLVARWRWWFPEVNTVDDSFRTLVASGASGRRDHRWQPTELAGPYRLTFTPDDPDQHLAAVDNLNGLLGVPWWQRDLRAAPDFSASIRRHVGLPWRHDEPIVPVGSPLP